MLETALRAKAATVTCNGTITRPLNYRLAADLAGANPASFEEGTVNILPPVVAIRALRLQ